MQAWRKRLLAVMSLPGALGHGGPARLLPRDQQANAVPSPERASIAMSRAAEECQDPNGRKWYKIRRFVESEKKVVTVSDQVEKAAGVEDCTPARRGYLALCDVLDATAVPRGPLGSRLPLLSTSHPGVRLFRSSQDHQWDSLMKSLTSDAAPLGLGSGSASSAGETLGSTNEGIVQARGRRSRSAELTQEVSWRSRLARSLRRACRVEWVVSWAVTVV